jgi:hypothetical protein
LQITSGIKHLKDLANSYKFNFTNIFFRYKLYLTPFLEIGNFTFVGHVDVEIDVKDNDAKNVTLHNDGLNIVERSIKIVGLKGMFEMIVSDYFVRSPRKKLIALFVDRSRPVKQANPKVLDYISQTMVYYPN